MKRILLIALAALPLCALAEPNWVVSGGNAPSEDVYSIYEIDANSVVKQKELVKAWARFSSSPARNLSSSTNKQFSSAVSLEFFDCANRESATMRINFYADKFGAGEIVHSEDWPKEALSRRMSEVIPGSLGEGNLDKVCEIAKSKVATKDRKKSK